MLLFQFFLLFSVVLNIALAFFVFQQGPSQRTNRFYAYTIFSIVVWGCGALLMNYSDHADLQYLGSMIAAFGYVFLPAFFLYFVATFTRKHVFLNNPFLFAGIFSLAFLFLYVTWTTDRIIHSVITLPTGTITAVGDYFVLVVFYYIVLFALSFGWLLDYALHARFQRERIESKYILFGTLFTIFAAIVTDILLYDKGYISHRWGVVFTALNAFIIMYAIIRYRILSVEDVLSTEQIFAVMSDGMIVVDSNLKILKANNTILDWLEAKERNVVGRILPEFLKGDPNLTKFVRGTDLKKVELYFFSSKKRKIPVNVSSALVKDASGDVLGAILVARDVRDKRLLGELRKVKSHLHMKVQQLNAFNAQFSESDH